jgi:hypothetical protein
MTQDDGFTHQDENYGSQGHHQEGGSGCMKYALIGCLAMVVLIVVGGVLAYHAVTGFMSGIVDEYTDTQPRELPAVVVNEEEAEVIVQRVETFRKAQDAGGATEPLVLDANDINQLIHHHPDWSELADKVYVTIEDDQIQGEVSIPLDDVGELVKGRYLNGAATFKVGLAAGRLVVFVETLEVNGKPIPNEFMEQLRSKNLAEDSHKDEDFVAVVEKIESITVQDGRIYIVPKIPNSSDEAPTIPIPEDSPPTK